uniref:Osiris 18 n=1 Tax=Megaselia scalaris TaxID=36166 RepID=T1GYZ2_MEGSC
LKDFSTSCVRPKALQWISNVAEQDEIKITNLMSVVRTTRDVPPPAIQGPRDARFQLFERLDNFLNTHAVKITPPAFFRSQEARSMIPDSLLETGLAKEVNVPLGGTSTGLTEGRGFMKKVMMPFLLGLKLKTTVLVPIALALIALKTWKAMTLGLLSLVLSGALPMKKMRHNVFVYQTVNMRRFLVVAVVATLALSGCSAQQSATDLAVDIYRTCLKDFSTSCVRPKALQWISNVADQDEIKITNLMSVVRTTRDVPPPAIQGPRDARFQLFER